VTTTNLRARFWIGTAASLVVGGVALTIGGQRIVQLLREQGVGASTRLSLAIWTTLIIVTVVANVSSVVVMALGTRALSRRTERLRNAIASIGCDTAETHSTIHLTADDDQSIALLNRAVQTAHAGLQASRASLIEESSRAHAALNTIQSSVFAVDGGGRIIKLNRSAEALFARPADALHGAVLSDLMAIESLQMCVDATGSVSIGDAQLNRAFRTGIRLYGRPVFTALAYIAPLPLEGQRAWAVSLHDLSEQHELEVELATVRATSDAAHRARLAFLGQMSIRIRTPLTAVLGYLKVVLRSKGSALNERDRHYLERARSNTDDLLTLVSDLLDLTRIETGTVDVNETLLDISDIVHETVAHFQGDVVERPVLLTADVQSATALARVDGTRLRQVLTNLVENAVRFTSRGSIRVTVCVYPGTALVSAVLVRDTGVGIPLERQQHIFGSFEQRSGENAVFHTSSGLGLALSQGIARQMGCTLSVESTPGRGSTFTLAFPLRGAEHGAPHQLATSNAA
jgi:signal transduction histidine kinase